MRQASAKSRRETVSILEKRLEDPRVWELFEEHIERGVSAQEMYVSVKKPWMRKQSHLAGYKWVQTHPKKWWLFAWVHGLGKGSNTYKSLSVRDIAKQAPKSYDNAIDKINDFIVGLEWEAWFDDLVLREASWRNAADEFDMPKTGIRTFEFEIVALSSNEESDEKQYVFRFAGGRVLRSSLFDEFPTERLVEKLREVGVWG